MIYLNYFKFNTCTFLIVGIIYSLTNRDYVKNPNYFIGKKIETTQFETKTVEKIKNF